MSTSSQSSVMTLEKSLQSYRVIAAPARLSYRYPSTNTYINKLHEVTGTDNARDLINIDGGFYWNEFIRNAARDGSITIASGIRVPVGVPCSKTDLENLMNIITDPNNAAIKKEQRKIVFSTNDGTRASGKDAFLKWNGFQVIDIDIKDRKIAEQLKYYIFNKLRYCNWFFGVAFSASGKSLHVYTKIQLPDEERDLAKAKLLYLTNFRHKYSFIYIACLDAMESIGFTKADLNKWLDLSMIRPAQGAFLGYDPDMLVNVNFFEDYIYFSYDNIDDLGHPELDWIAHPDLKEAFARWEWFEESPDTSLDIKMLNEASEAGPDGKQYDKIHYKHNERWRLANTLVNIFATRNEEGVIKNVSLPIKYMRSIVSNKVSDKEIIADCQTAARHNKPIDVWAVKQLNKYHGFKIKIDVENIDVGSTELMTSMERIDINPNQIRPSKIKYDFNITKNQYLSDILDNLTDKFGRTTLIEAGPGLGKTEMVKKLVEQGHKVMMILPFTSIIKSKVETQEGWYYAYGSRKPKLDVERGLALTIDKFSRLTLPEIQTAGFDYIFLDESHLLFMSEYRPVMPKVIDMIRNSPVPIVLMTGTPTGEFVFFPDLIHIHVLKEDERQKVLQVHLVDSTSTLFYHMCRAMAKDIADGNRILFPSNEGTLYSKRVEAGVKYFLEIDHAWTEPFKLQYYKKSNLGDEFMDKVNFNKTIEDANIVMCTTYMGCGVDIEDRFAFKIYFGDLCTAAECDQWCNRLRRNDLLVNMFIAKNDADGNSRNIHQHKPMNFQLDDDEIRDVHSILRICNAMIERNPDEYKYNSVVQSIVSDNRFIVYDDITCKYYIDEIAYKTVIFERKYRDYAQQLPVFMKAMRCYQYEVLDPIDHGAFSAQGPEIFRDVKNIVKLASDDQSNINTEHIEELMDLITDQRMDIYRDVMAGNYEIKKGNTWGEDENKKIMTVKSVEVFEKVVPIFMSMSKRFEIPVIRDIFEFCKTPQGRYNFSAINRIRTLINLVESDEAKRLDLPIKKFMEDAWHYADTEKTTKQEFDKWIKDHVNEYANRDSTIDVLIGNSKYTVERLTRVLERLFKCLVNCTRPDKKGNFEMSRVELLWEKKQFFSDRVKTATHMLDDFLEACAQSNIIDVNIKYMQPQPNEDDSQSIKDIPLNDDGTKSIMAMDDTEILEAGIVDDTYLPF